MTLDAAMSRHLLRETAISALVNAIFSVAFFLLVFAGLGAIPVWGIGNYAFDFLPQSFAIGFFATFVPGLLTAKAMRSGHLDMPGSPAPGVLRILLRAVLNGVAAMIVGGGTCAGLLLLSGAELFGYTAALLLKVVYGGLIGAIVTRLTLGRMTRRGQGQ